MIIDIHNHIVAGEELSRYQAGLINSRGFQGKRSSGITEEGIRNASWQGHKHTEVLDQVGTDMAFISPRPLHDDAFRTNRRKSLAGTARPSTMPLRCR